jgi:hypothetical protein
MGVPQHVRPHEWRGDASATCSRMKYVPDRHRAGEGLKGRAHRDEQVPRVDVLGSSVPKIISNCPPDGREERKRKLNSRLWPNDTECLPSPVDIVQGEPNDLTSTESIHAHHQQ